MSSVNKRALAWVSWFLISLFYAYQYVLRVVPNVMKDDIVEMFDINASAFGQYAGAYYVAYALMHIPMGMFFNRFKPNVVLSISILLCAISTLTLIYAQSWSSVVLGRIIIGAGSSAAVVGGFRVFQNEFKDKFTTVFGYMMTIGLVGAVYGGRPLTLLVHKFGWSVVVHSLTIFGCLLAAIVFFAVPNKGFVRGKNKGVISDVYTILKNKNLLIVSALGGLMIGPLEGFADAWGSGFLRAVHNIGLADAAQLSSSIFVFMAVGTAVLPKFAGLFNNRYNLLLAICAFMSGTFFILLLLPVQYTVWQFYIIFSIIGFFSAYQLYIFAQVPKMIVARLSSLAPTVSNMIMMIFGELYHSLVGCTMDAVSSNSLIVQQSCTYNKTAYIYAMLPIVFGLIIAGFAFMIKAKSEKKKLSLVEGAL